MKLAIFALVACGAIASPAYAQSTDNLIDRTESRLDNSTNRIPAGVIGLDEQASRWTLNVDVPVTYNTNIANVEHGKRRSLHGNPSVSIGRDFALGGNATLSFEAGADADLYVVDDAYDSSTLYGSVRATLGNPEASIAPYVDYTVIGIFDGVFENHAVTLHQVSVGASKASNLGDKAKLIVDANVMRREASIKEVEQTRGTFSTKVQIDAAANTAVIAAIRGQYVDYTGRSMSARRDKTLRASVAVRQTLAPQMAVTLQAKLDRNWSNYGGKDYAAWDFGPALNFSTKF